MRYENVLLGRFLSRPNRFVAHVLLETGLEVCHVKNTGRCRELLVKGAAVVLSQSRNPARKTRYYLVAVYKGDRLINIDSQAPNRIFREWAEAGNFLPDLRLIRPEYRYGQSRLDFYAEAGEKKCLIEVKGVTLEENGAVKFPDAPTLRGAKHMRELAEALREGYECYAFFIIQMSCVKGFTPNWDTDPAFSQALCDARQSGVHVLAYDCLVGEDAIRMGEPVPVFLNFAC
jgi:sugar fermentation stimulation protein A